MQSSDEFEIAPLENLVPPEGLDGRRGTRRCSQPCSIDAETDLEALQFWIAESSDSPETQRARRGVADKLLNWAYAERKKALSSFDPRDFGAFLNFAAAPRPVSLWIGPHAARRDSSAWRPFNSGLGPASLRSLGAHLRSMNSYFAESNYASLQFLFSRRHARDGLADSAFSFQAESTLNTTTPIPREEWDWVAKWMELEQGVGASSYTVLAVGLLYHCELRVDELAALTSDDLRQSKPKEFDSKLVRRRQKDIIHSIQDGPAWLADILERVAVGSAPFMGGSRNRIGKLLRQAFSGASDLAERGGDVGSAKGLRTRTAMSLRHAKRQHISEQRMMAYIQSV